VPPEEVKIAQPGIVQYVTPPNMLWYAPYCTIGGATQRCSRNRRTIFVTQDVGSFALARRRIPMWNRCGERYVAGLCHRPTAARDSPSLSPSQP